MAEDKWISTEGKEIILYIFWGLLFTILLPIFAGFVLRGFEESFTSGVFNISTYLGSFIVYFFLIIGALFLVIFPIGRIIAGDRNDHPATGKKPNWFTAFTISLIYSPEENGTLYRIFHNLGFQQQKNPMNWSLSILRCSIIAILIFGGLGILQVSYPQLNIAGVPQTSQQISTASDIIFGAGVPAFAENGILMIVFFLLLGINAYLCSKFKLGLAGFFIIGFFVICPLMGFFWMGMHSIIYSSSDTKLFATWIFGWLGSTITLLTGIFVFWFFWHFFNNFFIKLSSAISAKEDILFISILIWFAVLIIYIIAEILIYRYRKKKRERIIVPE